MFKVALLVAFAAAIVGNVQAEKKIVCYFGSWAVYRPGNGRIEISDIDPSLCTHMIYTFVGANADGTIKIADPWADLPDGGGKDGFNKFVARSRRSPGTKAMIAIGGWNEGSKLSKVVGNPQTRSRLVREMVGFLERYKFDGFDVDWEYPNQRGGEPSDRENFVALLRELRQAFDSRGYILGVAVGAVESSASLSYIIDQVARHVHFVSLMTYDLAGPWNKNAGHNSPLYASAREQGAQAKLNTDAAVRYWLSKGAPADKLVVGIPFYGRSFTLANPANNDVGAPTIGAGAPGPYTREQGILGYNEICESIRQGGWTVRRQQEQRVPFAVKGNQWVGYDDVQSVGEKCGYVKKNNLGGVMLWSLETDDFRGICGPKYPLLTKINEVLRGRVFSGSRSPANPPTTTEPLPPPSAVCSKEGYARDPKDCTIFYYCKVWNGQWFPIEYHCPEGSAFNPAIIACDHKDRVPGC